jgi:hypothetical protein
MLYSLLYKRLKTYFIGARNVGKANAQGITDVIVIMMDDVVQGWKDKIVGTGTDGAAVMLGSQNGVVAKLESLCNKKLFSVHCSAHRLELAYKDSTKSISLFKSAETVLLNNYLFYRKSPLNRNNLKQAFEARNHQPLFGTRIGGTRWVAHLHKAVSNLLRGYGPVVDHLTQV